MYKDYIQDKIFGVDRVYFILLLLLKSRCK